MSPLPEALLELLKDPTSLKILGTVGSDGTPHVAVRPSVTLLDDGTLAFAEELDSSQASRDLVFAVWHDRRVAVGVSRGRHAWEVRGRPWRCEITGPLLKRFLLEARAAEGPDADIAAVWVIRPEEARDESPATRRAEDAVRRPFAGSHLDRASLVRRDG